MTLRLSDYINDAHILASDSPYEVVCKLQRAIDARNFKDDDPMPRLDHNWLTGEPAASPEEIAEWEARQAEKRKLQWDCHGTEADQLPEADGPRL